MTKRTQLPRRHLLLGTLLAIGAGIAHAGHSNTVLTTQLSGQEEVGPDARIAGDPNGRGEAYVFGIDGDDSTLCYVLTVEKIQLVPVGDGMAAHIHEGARGENGPPVVFLAGPEDGDAADCIGGLDALLVQDILGNPSGFYINVHNPEYPPGALRGQLRALQDGQD
ncbi:CHRD domain-containing protein [Gallaecimonas sp. GXIMD4217]|uniref:CHRD domain-containing protein n=1 Tax=Gallaecimonas sp. GXIMD4217 TaxID=3131927 RepID=UPI00311AF75C